MKFLTILAMFSFSLSSSYGSEADNSKQDKELHLTQVATVLKNAASRTSETTYTVGAAVLSKATSGIQEAAYTSITVATGVTIVALYGTSALTFMIAVPTTAIGGYFIGDLLVETDKVYNNGETLNFISNGLGPIFEVIYNYNNDDDLFSKENKKKRKLALIKVTSVSNGEREVFHSKITPIGVYYRDIVNVSSSK